MSRRAMRGAKLQRGVALIAMLAVFVMGATYFLLRALNSQAGVIAAQHTRNAEVLNRAKQALVGYVAHRAALSSENNPGRLPCPEAPGFVGTSNEGIAAGNCTLPAVGRLPWRTLGLDKLSDADGALLWYAVSPGWALPTAGSLLTINSNTLGQLTLDGQANAAIALIFAPGAPMNVLAAAGCTARVQSRIAVPPDLRDYLECDNATFPADASFATNGPAASFNDQVLAVRTSDLLPALEAAIAHRTGREIVPVLIDVYEATNWLGIGGDGRLFPYAAPFSDPGSSTYVGTAGTYEGLLPFNQTQGCTFGAGNERCQPGLSAFTATPGPAVETLGWGYIQTQSCSWLTVNEVRRCTGEYHEHDTQPWRPIYLQMSATFANVAMGLRALDSSKVTIEARDDGSSAPWIVLTPSVAATMNPDGTATVTFGATMPNIDAMGWNTYADFRITVDRSLMADHALLSSTDPVSGWFVRNEWYRLLYYAAAQSLVASSLPDVGCATDIDCLRLSSWPNPAIAWDKRALLILAGRSLAGTPPSPRTLADFVEYDNANLDTIFEQQPISIVVPPNAATRTPFNDRIVVLDANP